MDPPPGFGLGAFHAGGISAQLELGFSPISFGFSVLALRLREKKKSGSWTFQLIVLLW